MLKCPGTRWLVSRAKKSLLLLSLVSTIFVLTILVMNLLHQTESRRLLLLMTGNRRHPDHAERSRGIVQYFPDNQNKALFRQRSVPDAPKDEVPRAKATGPGYEEEMKNRVFGILPQPPESPSSVNETSQVSYNVHIFYYTWYANKAYDGAYQHWNHKYLPNWDRRDRKRYPKGPHDPDHHDIGASFYPELGCYSSRDPKVMATHMKQIRKSGAGVVVVSWYPPGLADENGLPSDAVIEPLLNAAHSEELKIALLIEPYNDLNVTNLKTHLEYVRDRYWSHPAFYKRQVGRRQLPVFYVYDSYRVDSLQWQRLLSRKGDVSVRDTTLDAIFLGLLVEFRHRADIKRAKFDGFFTYFASNGFSHGSSWKNWKSLQDFSKKNSLIFVPSVGPGYNDIRIRPWNSANTRDRRSGSYYGMGWKTITDVRPSLVSITSFNEWHEGTQIEPAIPRTTDDTTFTYQSYLPNSPDFYLTETKKWIQKLDKVTKLL